MDKSSEIIYALRQLIVQPGETVRTPSVNIVQATKDASRAIIFFFSPPLVSVDTEDACNTFLILRKKHWMQV